MTATHINATSSLRSRIRGCLLGGLIGDAMGAPTEGKTYQQIAETFGEVTDFEGAGTDDTAIRLILIDAIVTSRGHPRVDDFADAFLRAKSVSYRLWWVPVKNMFHKLEAGVSLPADVGWGNMHSSSSAMAIAPMGILNAADPRRAARETFEVAGLIHGGPSGFARDAACAMASAIAAAFAPNATVATVLDAATAFLLPTSAKVMRDEIASTLELAQRCGTYDAFRSAFYERGLREIIADPRETVPVTLALFRLESAQIGCTRRRPAPGLHIAPPSTCWWSSWRSDAIRPVSTLPRWTNSWRPARGSRLAPALARSLSRAHPRGAIGGY